MMDADDVITIRNACEMCIAEILRVRSIVAPLIKNASSSELLDTFDARIAALTKASRAAGKMFENGVR